MLFRATANGSSCSDSSLPSKNFRIVSDLDDTIKISHTQKKLKTVARGLFRTSAYAGMSELYRELLTVSGLPLSVTALHILSSSPPLIRGRIENFLLKNEFPPAELLLRHWIRQPDVRTYKLAALEKIAAECEESLLLFGDDTEYDPEIFASFSERHPQRILAAYVHTVRGRQIPKGQIPFFTAFDVACHEAAAGRLSPEQVRHVGEAMLRAKKPTRLIPRFSLALPRNFLPKHLPQDEVIRNLWQRIERKIRGGTRSKP